MDIRQVEDEPRSPDDRPRPRVEAQEPDPTIARPIAAPEVGPEVELGESPEPAGRRDPARRDLGHRERHDPDPCLVLECVELELRWDQPFEGCRIDGPMGEEQVDPAHPDEPRRAHRRSAARSASIRRLTAPAPSVTFETTATRSPVAGYVQIRALAPGSSPVCPNRADGPSATWITPRPYRKNPSPLAPCGPIKSVRTAGLR